MVKVAMVKAVTVKAVMVEDTVEDILEVDTVEATLVADTLPSTLSKRLPRSFRIASPVSRRMSTLPRW